MTLRDDWKTWGAIPPEDALGPPPQHPRVNSLRAKGNYYASHEQTGSPIACAFYTTSGLVRILYVAWQHDRDLYFTTHGIWSNIEPDEPQVFLQQWRNEPFQRERPTDPARLEVYNMSMLYEPQQQVWESAELRYSEQRNFRFRGPLLARPAIGESFIRIDGAPQFYIRQGTYTRMDYPGIGPPGMPWPPSFDAFWEDQF